LPLETTTVLVLWDRSADRPRGKTHALKCPWALAVDAKMSSIGEQGYDERRISEIPAGTGRCSHC
jgi:hypothetical protein